MNKRLLWLITVILLATCSIANASYEEATAALNSGDYIKAYNEFKYLAGGEMPGHKIAWG